MIIASIIDVLHVGRSAPENGGSGAMMHFYSESDARIFCKKLTLQCPVPGGNPDALVYMMLVNTDTNMRWYYLEGTEYEG